MPHESDVAALKKIVAATAPDIHLITSYNPETFSLMITPSDDLVALVEDGNDFPDAIKHQCLEACVAWLWMIRTSGESQ